jgi:hypothetical protein
MYIQVASKLSVVTGVASYSQAVSMDGANAVMFDITVFSVVASSGTLTIQLEESNDLQNWAEVTSASETFATVTGWKRKVATGIAAAYVRLKFSFTTNGPYIVGAGINTALL